MKLTRREPIVENVAKAIYERAFDSAWEETQGAERELWLAAAGAAITAINHD